MPVTDIQYDLLDELYFTVSFSYLKNESGLSDAELKKELLDLRNKGWVKFLDESEDEIVDLGLFEKEFLTYSYLATKEGLFAHNSR